jgi:hypothetical protein
MTTRPTSATLTCAAVAGMVGLCAPTLAFIIGGVGHGWVAPLFPSLGLVVVGPLVGVAWIWQDRWWGLILTCLLAVLLIAGDGFILSQTQAYMDGFWRAWQRTTGFVIAWFVVWAYPHVLLSVALCARRRRRDAGPPIEME